MRLNKILHPEVLLGKRGEATIHKFYKDTVHDIIFQEENGGGVLMNKFVAGLNKSEQRAMTLMRRWQVDNGKVYHISSDFLLALSKVRRGLNLDYLPDRFVGYLSFAGNTLYDDEDEVEGAYVYVGPSKYTSLQNTAIERVLWVAYICKGSFATGTVCMELKQGDTIEEMCKRLHTQDHKYTKTQMYVVEPKDMSKRNVIFNTIVNVVMYLYSQEPNVQRIPGVNELSNKKATELAHKTGLRNDCTLPVTFINWTYAKQRIYGVDSTWVESHLRWQICGVGRSQVKLIFVKEHERHYKNTEVTT